MDLRSLALVKSLKNAPLLSDDLPIAKAFDRSLFADTPHNITINFDQKLGHIYEQALESLINASPSLSCLASHIQIFDETKRTIGELDFILFDHTHKKHVHLELAVKFYLAYEGEIGWVYPGPNATDNWHRKLAHMESHQLKLSQTKEAKKLLAERFEIDAIEQRQLIYGCLFVPIDSKNAAPEPASMSKSRQRGEWLYASQWHEHFGDLKDVFIIPKPLWPLEISPETIPLFEGEPAQTLLERANKNCTMFMREGSRTKYFLVPNIWPGLI